MVNFRSNFNNNFQMQGQQYKLVRPELLRQRQVSTGIRPKQYYHSYNSTFQPSNRLLPPSNLIPQPSPNLWNVFSNKVSSLWHGMNNSIRQVFGASPQSYFQDRFRLVTTSHKDAHGKNIKLTAEAAYYFEQLVNLSRQRGITLKVVSSYRSVSHQERLFSNAIKKYGSEKAAGKWVAPPGKSQHNYGNAIDLYMYRNGKKITQAEFDQVISQAGFYRPMSYEGWHIEPLTTKGIRNEIRKRPPP